MTKSSPIQQLSDSLKSLHHSNTPRKVFVNLSSETRVKYARNQVKTSKYTIFTFLPKNLFEQFHGLANFYFLGVVILQIFPQFSTVGIIVPVLPVVVIILITALKDGFEDYKRHAADSSVNKSIAYVLDDWINSNVSHRSNLTSPFQERVKTIADLFNRPSSLDPDSKKIYHDILQPDEYIQKSAQVADSFVKPSIGNNWKKTFWKDVQGNY